MANQFASGKKALGICDRCGWTYKLDQLKTERQNLTESNVLVCPKCWDPDHPQNLQGRIDYSDPQALRNPRIDTDTGAGYTNRFRTSTGYEFLTSAEGWTAQDNSTVAWSTDQYIRWTTTSFSATNAIRIDWAGSGVVDPDVHKVVRARVRLATESSASDWVGLFRWSRTGDGAPFAPVEAARPQNISNFGDRFQIIEWDITGKLGWNNILDYAYITLYTTSGNVVDFDYVRFESI
jgi:hypothetical protein